MPSSLLKIFCLLLFCFGCSKEPSSSSTKPLVLVSTAPYKFFVERITQGVLDVEAIVPQQADPHTFEPTLRQVASFSRATLWLRIREPFEKKLLAALKKKNPSLQTYDLLKGGVSNDRHTWLDPTLASLQAEKIAERLSRAFPEKRALFQENMAQLRLQLEELDREIQERLDPLKRRSLLVAHPAFSSFCKRYQLEQLALEEEGKEARPKQATEVLQKALAIRPATALLLPQHNNRGVELLAEQLEVPIHSIDPNSSDYFEMMRTLTRLIAQPEMP